MVNYTYEHDNYSLLTLYAPNVDTPDFYVQVCNDFEDFATGHKIICGDYNLTLNSNMDRWNSTNENQKSQDVLCQYIEDNNLMDIWRVRHPTTRQYTWERMNPTRSASRLDFFLVDCCVNTWVEDCYIKSCIHTDHKMVVLSIYKPEVQRGPGVWKMNNTLLSDHDCMLEIDKLLDSCTNIAVDAVTKWEYIKEGCANIFKKHSRKKAHVENLLCDNLYHLKQIYEDQYLLECNITSIKDAYEAITAKIEQLEEEKVQGAIFRSGARWANEGEKNTKYFFALEKRKYMNKNMFAVFRTDGTLSTCQKDILQEQYSFYKALYSADTSITFELQNHGVQISNEVAATCDEPITLSEVTKALNTMKNNKCPGSDGLTVEFYKATWPKLQSHFMDMVNQVMVDGQLGPSARRGLMQLIPKKDKDTRHIRNMRPLTLLNNDYKLIATTIAVRLKPTLQDIIGEQQSGFMEGRTIHSNIRCTMDILSYLNEESNEENIILLSLDFVKCFDMVEYCAIYGALRYFGFGRRFINMVKIFYTNFSACTQNFGFLSPYFLKTRSLNQGCPLSCFVFLCAETMAHLITHNRYIEGVKLGRSETTLMQFADDAGIFLQFKESVLRATMATLEKVRRNTGLTISEEKSRIFRLGRLKNTDKTLCKDSFSIQWSDNDIEMLGVTVTNQAQQSSMDYEDIIRKMKTIAEQWILRSLTLMGKVLVINTLMASLFVYKMTVLPDLTSAQINAIHKIIINFLWNGAKPKIPLEILQLPQV